MIKDSRVVAREHFEMRHQRSEQLALAAAEAKHQDEVVLFRADVIKAFKRHGALRGARPWMLFELERQSSDDNPEGVIMEEREILITMFTSSDPNDESPPLIRIYSNQVVGVDGQAALMTEDVTVDQFGDAQYMMDAIDNDILKEPGWYSDKTHGVIFRPVEDDKMGYWNRCPYTPFTGVVAFADKHRDMVMPYGEPDEPRHREYALYKAQEMFLATSNLQPVAIGLGA